MGKVECPTCRTSLGAARWPTGASVICPGCSTIFTPEAAAATGRVSVDPARPGAVRSARAPAATTVEPTGAEPRVGGSKRVRVAGQSLNIPRLCCCCGASYAPGEFSVAAMRRAGGDHGRFASRRWTFRLCLECEEWMEAERDAALAQTWFVRARWLIALCVAAPLLSWFWAWATLPLGLLAWRAADEIHDRRQNVRRRAAAIRPRPQCSVRPVEYLDWNGSVHTFYFACSEFRESFVAANARKLVG